MARNAMATELECSLGEGSVWSQLGWAFCDWLSPDGSERWVYCGTTAARFRLSDLACLAQWRVAQSEPFVQWSLWLGDAEPVLALVVRRDDGRVELQRWSFSNGESRCVTLYELDSEYALLDITASERSGCLLLWCGRHVVIDVIAGEVRGALDGPAATESQLPRAVFDRDRVRWVTNAEIRTESLVGAPTVRAPLAWPLSFESLTELDETYALLTNATAPYTVTLLHLQDGSLVALDDGPVSRAWITDRSLYVRYGNTRVTEYALDTGARQCVFETTAVRTDTRPLRGDSLLDCSPDGWQRYDRRTLALVDELVARSAPNTLALDADGALLAACGDKTLVVYDLRARATVLEHTAVEPIRIVQWLDSGALLLTKMQSDRTQRFVECAFERSAVIEHVEARAWEVDVMTYGAQATRDGRARLFQARRDASFVRTAMVRSASGAWVELDLTREAMNPYEVALVASDDEASAAIATVDCNSGGRWTRVTLTEDGATDQTLLSDRTLDTPVFARGVALCVEREGATRARWYALSPDGSFVDLPLEAYGARVYFARDVGVFATVSEDRARVFVVDLQGALRATIHLPSEQTVTALAMGHQGERVFVGVSTGEVLVYRVEPGDHRGAR